MMKFRVSMKDPDTLYDAIRDAVEEQVKTQFGGLPDIIPEDWEPVKERRVRSIEDLCSKWFMYGEYLEVEIDTDAKTCTVVENGGR